jgi:threonine synthase
MVDIILPTGAMGNIAGGYMAKNMGVPIGKLCAGVNINDISHRVIDSGKFYKSERMEKTLSDAINIQVVSVKKYIFDICSIIALFHPTASIRV